MARDDQRSVWYHINMTTLLIIACIIAVYLFAAINWRIGYGKLL
jgi:hypothetical protein